VPTDLRIFGPQYNLPPLPALGITIAFDRARPSALVTAFADHIRAVLPKIQQTCSERESSRLSTPLVQAADNPGRRYRCDRLEDEG
jgi:hypothetical protein